MGDSRQNPRSPAYTGPLPEFVIDSVIKTSVEPTQEWIDKTKPLFDEARAKGQPMPAVSIPDEDKVIVQRLVTTWTVPMRTASQWPQAQINTKELARTPYLELKGRVRDIFAETNPALVGTLGLEEKPAPVLVAD